MKKDLNSKDDIQLFVNSFYDKVKTDSLLGPVFNKAINNWDEHLPIMYDFWESTLFNSGTYRRNTLQIHLDLHQNQIKLQSQLFNQWLELFNQTIDKLFEGPTANLAKTRALSIATVMQMKVLNL